MIQVVEGGIKRAVKSCASVLVLVLAIVRLSLAGMDGTEAPLTSSLSGLLWGASGLVGVLSLLLLGLVVCLGPLLSDR